MPKRKANATTTAPSADATTTAAVTDAIPRVIIFDLDGTCWDPDMYMLRAGAPFKPHKSNPNVMIGRGAEAVTLCESTRSVLQMLSTDPVWADTHLAISSTCDYPAWARELLTLFTFATTNDEDDATAGKSSGGHRVTMGSLFGADLQEIYYANKAAHHRTILERVGKVDPSVTEYSQMLFFDNQMNNIRDVSPLGVTCCFCPGGLERGVFERGLEQWRKKQASL